jgi:hypothetical protein
MSQGTGGVGSSGVGKELSSEAFSREFFKGVQSDILEDRKGGSVSERPPEDSAAEWVDALKSGEGLLLTKSSYVITDSLFGRRSWFLPHAGKFALNQFSILVKSASQSVTATQHGNRDILGGWFISKQFNTTQREGWAPGRCRSWREARRW